MRLAGLLWMGVALAVGQSEHHTEAKFQNGGEVRLDLGAGDYEIVPGDGDRVVVTWSGPTANQSHGAVAVNGNRATVTTTTDRMRGNDVRYRIELPVKSDVAGKILVGDVKIGPVSGNVDLSLGTGDLTALVSDAGAYGEVRASVNVGDLNGGPFHGTTTRRNTVGGEMHYSGTGKRVLKLQVGTGDVKIEGGAKEKI